VPEPTIDETFEILQVRVSSGYCMTSGWLCDASAAEFASAWELKPVFQGSLISWWPHSCMEVLNLCYFVKKSPQLHH
jgi:hypothetical protein